MKRTHPLAATIGAVLVAAAALVPAAGASNVAWSVSLGGPGFAVSAGQPGFAGGPSTGSPWRPHWRPAFRPVVVAPPVGVFQNQVRVPVVNEPPFALEHRGSATAMRASKNGA